MSPWPRMLRPKPGVPTALKTKGSNTWPPRRLLLRRFLRRRQPLPRRKRAARRPPCPPRRRVARSLPPLPRRSAARRLRVAIRNATSSVTSSARRRLAATAQRLTARRLSNHIGECRFYRKDIAVRRYLFFVHEHRQYDFSIKFVG